MYTKNMLAELNRKEWLELRKSGIGGSDAGAICGLNPFSSAIKVYQDKTSTEVSDYDNEAMRQGRDLEDYVARRFTEETGLKIRRSNVMYRSVSHPFMIADVDRMIVGEDAGLECKTASAYNADKWKDGAIPAHYAIQCYHYMAVTGRRSWYIAVLLLGQGFRYAKLTWDDEIIHSLIQLEENFWNNHVLAHVMPDPDGSKVCDEVLNQYFHMARKDSMIPLIGFDEKLDRRAELGRLIEKMQQEQHQIDQEIKLYMGDHELASSDRYQVAWSNVESTRLDAKRLKADLPDIYRSYGCHSISRRFSVRSA